MRWWSLTGIEQQESLPRTGSDSTYFMEGKKLPMQFLSYDMSSSLNCSYRYGSMLKFFLIFFTSRKYAPHSARAIYSLRLEL